MLLQQLMNINDALSLKVSDFSIHPGTIPNITLRIMEKILENSLTLNNIPVQTAKMDSKLFVSAKLTFSEDLR